MVKSYQAPIRVYKYPFEFCMMVSVSGVKGVCNIIVRLTNCDFPSVSLYHKCWPLRLYLRSGARIVPATPLSDDVPWILTPRIY